MVNRRGYLRTLEAIVAVLIIFGFLLFIFPKTDRIEGQMPHELDSLADAMLEEIENNDKFRKCVLADVGAEVIEGEDGFESGAVCVNGFIKTLLPPFSVWGYAFSISDGETTFYYEPIEDGVRSDNVGVLPDDKSVFTKSVFVSVDDVAAFPYELDQEDLGEYKTFNIYFWEK